MTLHEVLLALRDEATRGGALAALEGDLAGRLRALVDRHDDLDGAAREVLYDHLRDRIVANEHRYRGEHGEGSAWAWVGAIVERKANDLRRQAARARRYAEARAGELTAQAAAEAQERSDYALARQVHGALLRLADERPPDPAVTSDWNEHVELAFAARWNPQDSRTEFEARGLIRAGERDPAALLRARDLLYQRRRRGRVRLAELLEVLVERGLLDPASAERVARMHKAPWPPPPRRRAAPN